MGRGLEGGIPLIFITRLNGRLFVVNADLIETVEATPDTVVTLTSGSKYIVRETVDEIIRRVVAFRRRIAMPLAEELGAEAAPEAPGAGQSGA
jgi:flagellar protein FlbD